MQIPEDRVMGLSGVATCLSSACLVLAFGLAVSGAGQAEQPAQGEAQVTKKSTNPNRQLRSDRRVRRVVPGKGRNARGWQPGPIPATITVNVSGTARNEEEKAIVGATITLYTITDNGAKPLGTATTDDEGRYVIRDATLPVSTSLSKEITPYGRFILCGMARGFGIAWSPQSSMYALKEPHPDDIQERRPLKYGNDSRQNGPLSSRFLHIACTTGFAVYVET
jgi:hypothetical protein